MVSFYDCVLCMEGDLSKKSIHINESFVHAIYIGIVVIYIPILLLTYEFILLISSCMDLKNACC